MNKTAKKYLKDVAKGLPCRDANSRKMLNELKHSVSDVYVSNSSMEYSDLISRFGSPEEIAGSYISEYGAQYVKHNYTSHKIKIAILILFIAILAFVASVAIVIHINNDREPTYYETSIWEGEPEIVEGNY